MDIWRTEREPVDTFEYRGAQVTPSKDGFRAAALSGGIERVGPPVYVKLEPPHARRGSRSLRLSYFSGTRREEPRFAVLLFTSRRE